MCELLSPSHCLCAGIPRNCVQQAQKSRIRKDGDDGKNVLCTGKRVHTVRLTQFNAKCKFHFQNYNFMVGVPQAMQQWAEDLAHKRSNVKRQKFKARDRGEISTKMMSRYLDEVRDICVRASGCE